MAPQKPSLILPTLDPHPPLACLDESASRVSGVNGVNAVNGDVARDDSPALTPAEPPSKPPFPQPLSIPAAYPLRPCTAKLSPMTPFCQWQEWQKIAEAEEHHSSRPLHCHSGSDGQPDHRNRFHQPDVCTHYQHHNQNVESPEQRWNSNSAPCAAGSGRRHFREKRSSEDLAHVHRTPSVPCADVVDQSGAPANGAGGASPLGAVGDCLNFKEVEEECQERQLDRDTLDGLSIIPVLGESLEVSSTAEQEQVVYSLSFTSDSESHVLPGNEQVRCLLLDSQQFEGLRSAAPREPDHLQTMGQQGTKKKPAPWAGTCNLATFAEWQHLS